ncbi:MAG: PAS domain S-box protein [Phycisphaerales bacterium]|nr:PAS domain S-box protein [Phycisphaerales bacterium]
MARNRSTPVGLAGPPRVVQPVVLPTKPPVEGRIVNMSPGAEPRPASRDALSAVRDRAVLAAVVDPIITIDAYGLIQSASQSVERVFGWTPDELFGRNVNVLMPEPHRSAHDGYLANYRRTGQTKILGRARELEGVRKSGESIPIEVSISRVDPPDGGLPFFVGVIRDATERKRMEWELRVVKDLALSISGAAILSEALTETLRLVCTFTEWDYGEAWMPTPEGDELVGTASWMRPDSGLDNFARTTGQIRLRRGVGLGGRAWVTGSPVWAADVAVLGDTDFRRSAAAREAGLHAATAVPIVSEGKVIVVLQFFVRVTRLEDLHVLEVVRAAVAPLGTLIQRKRAEEELDKYRCRLEEKVDERTRSLKEAQEKLRMADRLASIGTLAAGLGHDMNNVLMPVRARLNAIRAERAGLSIGVRKHIDTITKSIAYLQQLADGLHFLAMDPENDDGDAGTTDLAAWWAQTGPVLTKAVPKHMKVTASIPSTLPRVAIAPHALTQAVLNLIVNAGDAIPADRKRRQGLARISAVAVGAGPAGEERVRLSVTDNGRGMNEETRRRAFDIFFTTKARGVGTGLGLPLVRRVVEHAGGSVDIESELGRGTTMSMTFPAARAIDQDPGGVVRRAVVSIGDGRAAGLIRHLLEAAGFSTAISQAPGDASVWVVDARTVTPQQATEWRDRQGGHARLVVIGDPTVTDPARASEWRSLEPLTCHDPSDFEAVKAMVALVAASE